MSRNGGNRESPVQSFTGPLWQPVRFLCFTGWNQYAWVLYLVTSTNPCSNLSVNRNCICPIILANWWEGLSKNMWSKGERASFFISQQKPGVPASSQDLYSRRCLSRDGDRWPVVSVTPSRGQVVPVSAALCVSSWDGPWELQKCLQAYCGELKHWVSRWGPESAAFQLFLLL